jgi:predicted lactoylglutathione lyase
MPISRRLQPNEGGKRQGGKAMRNQIFVSLPVTDLKASMAFYQSIGFKNNPQFTDETAACMVWSEAINFMLLTHAKWRNFTSRPIPPKTSSEVMLALSCDSRDAVDAMSEAAAANGGIADINPVEDQGFMYTRDLADPDGHALGAMWMDMSAVPVRDKAG